jgi:uncharacterized protein
MTTTRHQGAVVPAGTADQQPLVRENRKARCFEIYVGQHLAGYLSYRLEHGEIWLIETIISRQYRIDNLVPHLAGCALETARRRRLKVRPVSPAVRHFMAIHPEYGSAAADGSGRELHPVSPAP